MIRRLDFRLRPMAGCAACVIIPTAFALSARRRQIKTSENLFSYLYFFESAFLIRNLSLDVNMVAMYPLLISLRHSKRVLLSIWWMAAVCASREFENAIINCVPLHDEREREEKEKQVADAFFLSSSPYLFYFSSSFQTRFRLINGSEFLCGYFKTISFRSVSCSLLYSEPSTEIAPEPIKRIGYAKRHISLNTIFVLN